MGLGLPQVARILHVCSSSDYAHVHRVLPALVSAGHEVHFVSAAGVEPQRLITSSDVGLHTVPIVRGVDPVSDLQALAALCRLMHRLKPDLVHAHTPKGGLLGMLAARMMNVPARIYQLHGLRYQTTKGKTRQLLMNCDRVAARAASRVICVSPSVKERAVGDGIVPKHKAVLLENGSAQGIDVDEFEQETWANEAGALADRLGIAPRSVCVLYLGRIAADKGLSDLAIAWRGVAESRPDAHLVLAGNADPTDPIDLEIFKTLPRVHLVPHQDDPRPLLALADVVTLPSYREGLPQTILEAGAMKKPVVATRVTGVIDALREGETGLLVPPHDPKALARALLSLLGDAELRRQMGEAGREDVGQRFQFAPIMRETLALYRTVLESGGR